MITVVGFLRVLTYSICSELHRNLIVLTQLGFAIPPSFDYIIISYVILLNHAVMLLDFSCRVSFTLVAEVVCMD